MNDSWRDNSRPTGKLNTGIAPKSSAVRRLWMAAGLLATMLATSAIADDRAIRVTTQPLSEVNISVQKSSPATIIALRQADLAARISGVVAAIHKETGDTVAAGDALLTIDCTEYDARLAAARSRLEAARASFDLSRYLHEQARSLRKSKTISEEQERQRHADFIVARARIGEQQAQLAELAYAVDHCTVMAPFNGVLLHRQVNQGDWLAPGTMLFQILDPASLEVSAQVSATKVNSLHQAATIHVVINGQQLSVNLRKALPAVDEKTKTTEVRLTLPPEARLHSGASARLTWSDGKTYLPANLLVERNGILGVFIADNKVARFKPLPAARPGQPAAASIPETTPIIIEGRYSVEDGTPIAP